MKTNTKPSDTVQEKALPNAAPNARDRAYELLRKRIIGGRYEPGRQLKEVPLSREMMLSRTPVRTALKRLVADGLATDEAGQGIRVAAWSEWDLEESYRLRIILEAYASYLAAIRGKDDLSAKLQKCNDRMAAGIKLGGMAGLAQVQSANREFHHAIMDASHSPRLCAMLETIIDIPIISRSFDLYTEAELWQSIHHHNDIIRAVEARDGETARQAMQLHLRMSYHRFRRHRTESGAE